MMTVNELRLDKIIGLQARGLLSEAEVVNGLLLMFADEENTNEIIVAMFETLPSDVQNSMQRKLNELQVDNYPSQPLLLGEGIGESELKRLSVQLRRFHELIS